MGRRQEQTETKTLQRRRLAQLVERLNAYRAGGWGLDSILCLRVIGRTNAKGINTPGK